MSRTELQHLLLHASKKDTTAYMQAHPHHFQDALEMALSDRQPLAWRAASLVKDCMKPNDPRVSQHLNHIVKLLPTKSDSQLRELLLILQKMRITEELEGPLFDLCLQAWQAVDKRPSIRYTALKTILTLVKKYPELSSEISFLTEDHYLETLSPAIRRGVQKSVGQLHRPPNT